MKKIVLWGTVLAFTSLLTFSCNKNRFDTEALQNVSIEGSGQWKLPIGSVSLSLGKMLDQLDETGRISYDGDSNVIFHFPVEKDDLIKGSTFLSLGNLNLNANVGFDNFVYGLPGIEPIDTVFRFTQKMRISRDSIRVESFELRSGSLIVGLTTNLGSVSEVELLSSDVVFPNGRTLHESFSGLNHSVSLEGATFTMVDPITGEQDSTVVFEYRIHYKLNAADAPHYDIQTRLTLNQLKVKEISGYIDHLVYNFAFDEDFTLPLAVDGQLSLKGTKILIKGKNTFGTLAPAMTIAEAEFRGQAVPPIPFLEPVTLTLNPSTSYVPVMPEKTLNLTFNTKNNIMHFAGSYDLNPDGADRLLTLTDDSSIGLAADLTIPMHFNIPGVTYYDTLDVDLSSISATEFVNEIDLNVLFNSKMPFNLKASLYSFNSQTGQITGTIMENLLVPRSTDGTPVQRNEVIALTQATMRGLMESDKIIMELGVDTDNKDIWINYHNGLDMTIKADVIYGGTVDVNN